MTEMLIPVTGRSLLITLGLVVVAGITGVIYSSENTVQIIGFCTLISVQLLNRLSQAKAEESAAVEVSGVKHTLLTATSELTDKVDELHKVTNSRLDQLLEVTKSESHAAGVKEEKERHK